MAADVYTQAVRTIRLVVILTALGFLTVGLQTYARLAQARDVHYAPSVDLVNGKRDVVKCKPGQVAYVDRQDSAGGCEAVVLHVTGGYVR